MHNQSSTSLYFENLADFLQFKNPEVLRNVTHGTFGDFYKFLKDSREYAEKQKHRIDCEPASENHQFTSLRRDDGIWIQLKGGALRTIEEGTSLYRVVKGDKKVYLHDFTVETAAKKTLKVLKVKREENSEDIILEVDKQPECDELTLDKGYWVNLLQENNEHTLKQFLDETTKYVDPHQSTNGKPERVAIVRRDVDSAKLLLDSKIKRQTNDESLHQQISIRPNVHTLTKQMHAVSGLQKFPHPKHAPLVNLILKNRPNTWPVFPPEEVDQWFLLRDGTRDGVNEQRNFVRKALATKDFAIMEGPPGSGKTTVICELISQAIHRGQKILLCSSTHVAVDNVIERLMAKDGDNLNNNVLPVRIGDTSSEIAGNYKLDAVTRTWKNGIIKSINDKEKEHSSVSTSQETLRNACRGEEAKFVQSLVLQLANLVCGTTIGILQHPDIKKEGHEKKGPQTPKFDMLIIDEASKTTFQEFLVPALLAKKWVLVGDTMQLPPYSDQDELAGNIRECIKLKDIAEQIDVCHHWHLFHHHMDQRAKPEHGIVENVSLIIVVDIKELHNSPIFQSEKKDDLVRHGFLDEISGWEELIACNVIYATPQAIDAKQHLLPLDISHVVNLTKEADQAVFNNLPVDFAQIRFARERRAAEKRKKPHNLTRPFMQDKRNPESALDELAGEIAWRLKSLFDQRKTGAIPQQEQKAYDDLMHGFHEKIQTAIQNIKRLALPSILESLKDGIPKRNEEHADSTLNQGFKKADYLRRSEKLTYQHRMHPAIAAFPRKHFYEGEALKDAGQLEREFGFENEKYRICWLKTKSVATNSNKQSGKRPRNESESEAQAIIEKLEQFVEWAHTNPPASGKVWEIAILTFYTDQEGLLRGKLRKLTKNNGGTRYFRLPKGKVRIQLCTVDRFQGQEADVVFLSIAKDHITSFLRSPNRLNVALTRARFQLYVVGNRSAFAKKKKKPDHLTPALEALARSETILNLSINFN